MVIGLHTLLNLRVCQQITRPRQPEPLLFCRLPDLYFQSLYCPTFSFKSSSCCRPRGVCFGLPPPSPPRPLIPACKYSLCCSHQAHCLPPPHSVLLEQIRNLPLPTVTVCLVLEKWSKRSRFKNVLSDQREKQVTCTKPHLHPCPGSTTEPMNRCKDVKNQQDVNRSCHCRHWEQTSGHWWSQVQWGVSTQEENTEKEPHHRQNTDVN